VVTGDAEPRVALDELEFGDGRIEPPHHHQRDREGDERRPQRNPARGPAGKPVIAVYRCDEQRADQRQEGDDGEDRPAHG